jgi:hypothetical protein
VRRTKQKQEAETVQRFEKSPSPPPRLPEGEGSKSVITIPSVDEREQVPRVARE